MSKMVNIVGFVFARGGSKGVPDKNVRALGGKPLIAHSIDTALQSRYLSRVVVSTDSPKIAGVARRYGAEVPFLRPAELASDTADERLAWRHAIEQVESVDGRRIDVFVSVPPTCPLRRPADIDAAIEALLACDGDIVLTAAQSRCNPYFNMITIDDSGVANIAAQTASRVTRRQDAPSVYELTAVAYAARRDPIFRYESIFESDARAIEIPEERSIDIDTESDFRLAEFFHASQPASSSCGRAA